MRWTSGSPHFCLPLGQIGLRGIGARSPHPRHRHGNRVIPLDGAVAGSSAGPFDANQGYSTKSRETVSFRVGIPLSTTNQTASTSTPGDLRVRGLQVLGELLTRFANNLELTDDGILPMGFGHELDAPDAGVLFDSQNRVADMEQIGPVAKPGRFHKVIAFLRTASRI